MKTKLIGYGIILATFSNIMEAEPKDGEDVAQPSEAARFIAEVLQVQLFPNPKDITLPFCYGLEMLLTERQILALKYLCTQLGPQFGCDSIHPHTPLAKDLAALCDAYNPDSHYDFLLREPAPIPENAFLREVLQSLSEKVKKQEEIIAKQKAEIEDLSQTVKDNSEIIKLQEENIKKLIVIIQDGERIAMEILKRCGQSFVPTEGYELNLKTLEGENTAFLTQNQGFPLTKYVVAKTNVQDKGAKGRVENLGSSPDVWAQCLDSVEKMETKNKEAIEQERTKTSEAERSLKAAQAKALEVEGKNKQLIIEKQRVEQLASDLQKANELGSAEVQRLNTQLKEAQSNVQTITKEITIIRTQTVDKNEVIDRINSSGLAPITKSKVIDLIRK